MSDIGEGMEYGCKIFAVIVLVVGTFVIICVFLAGYFVGRLNG